MENITCGQNMLELPCSCTWGPDRSVERTFPDARKWLESGWSAGERSWSKIIWKAKQNLTEHRSCLSNKKRLSQKLKITSGGSTITSLIWDGCACKSSFLFAFCTVSLTSSSSGRSGWLTTVVATGSSGKIVVVGGGNVVASTTGGQHWEEMFAFCESKSESF